MHADFAESTKGEVRRTLIPRTPVNRVPKDPHIRHQVYWSMSHKCGQRVTLLVR